MISKPIKLDKFSDLRLSLGENFVIFCGSAVSKFTAGKDRIFLPMVSDITADLFTRLGNELISGNYYDQTLAAYAQALVSGKHRFVRLNVKFERFLGQLENALGSENQVKAFLKALFLCDAGQFTHNHSAIAALLETRKAIGCLTTNFDNAIEIALPSITDHKYVHPNYPNVSVFESNACLVKLHGDVIAGTYIATLNRLLTAEQAKEHQYLGTLLKGRTVLVLGYSGYGDLDIAPYLRDLADNGDTKFIWAVYQGEKPPDYTNYYFETDLSQMDPNQNWLLQLADDYGHRSEAGSGNPDWEKRAEVWFKTIEQKRLSTMIRAVLLHEVGWPILHLHHVEEWWSEHNAEPQDSSRLAFQHGEACIQVGTYNSARKSFESVIPHDGVQEFEIVKWLGFIAWRSGRYDDAVAQYSKIIDKASQSYSPEYLMLYLEAARDKLLYSSPSKRRRFYDENRLDKLEQRLLDEMGQLSLNRSGQVLSKFDILYLHLVVGLDVQFEELETLYKQSISIHEWGFARAIARVMLMIDYSRGNFILEEIKRIAPQHKDANDKRKDLSAHFQARVPQHLAYRFDVFDGPTFKVFLTAGREVQYKVKYKKWKDAFMSKIVFE